MEQLGLGRLMGGEGGGWEVGKSGLTMGIKVNNCISGGWALVAVYWQRLVHPQAHKSTYLYICTSTGCCVGVLYSVVKIRSRGGYFVEYGQRLASGVWETSFSQGY